MNLKKALSLHEELTHQGKTHGVFDQRTVDEFLQETKYIFSTLTNKLEVKKEG